jgi:purine-binding chemotaxis protein CheW
MNSIDNAPAAAVQAVIATATAATTEAQPARRMPSEFLAFKLGAEEYGIDILRVQEIRSYEEPTRIANAPAFVKGIVNLRGVIVPVLDMRLKFNLAEARCDQTTVVIVLNLPGGVVGMVVDAVSDVITPSADQLRPVPEFNDRVDTEHLLAIGAIGERMLLLIDIEKLMSSPEMGLAHAAVQ